MKKRDAVLEDGEVGFWALGQGVMELFWVLALRKQGRGDGRGGKKDRPNSKMRREVRTRRESKSGKKTISRLASSHWSE